MSPTINKRSQWDWEDTRNATLGKSLTVSDVCPTLPYGKCLVRLGLKILSTNIWEANAEGTGPTPLLSIWGSFRCVVKGVTYFCSGKEMKSCVIIHPCKYLRHDKVPMKPPYSTNQVSYLRGLITDECHKPRAGWWYWEYELVLDCARQLIEYFRSARLYQVACAVFPKCKRNTNERFSKERGENPPRASTLRTAFLTGRARCTYRKQSWWVEFHDVARKCVMRHSWRNSHARWRSTTLDITLA